jgi:large subunit ribosomal protein L3
MLNVIYTTKQTVTQTWDQTGVRVPYTVLTGPQAVITQVKTVAKDGYNSVQIAVGETKQTVKKPMVGHLKTSNLEKHPLTIKEIRLPETEDMSGYQPGQALKISDYIKVGDLVKITGTSKGRGFAGVVKRWHFKGGPRTHGQSDRERAPGSVGQGTTPGRVFKNKKMAGHFGNTGFSVKNLKVINLLDNEIWISGTVPGSRGSLVKITRTGEGKFAGLYNSKDQAVVETVAPEKQAAENKA